MKITYDEYIATWQAPAAKEDLNSIVDSDKKRRYEARWLGAGSNPESIIQLSNMSPTEFRSLRIYQIGQLLQAYKDSTSGRDKKLMWITPYITDPNDIRRVVGNKAGYIYNSDVLALDQDTIDAVNYIAKLGNGDYNYQNKELFSSLTPYNLEAIVDEMIACKEILTENMNIDYTERHKIYDETDIVKRAIGKVQYRSYDEMDKFLHQDQVGINVFGINDYELNWQQLMNRQSKAWTKTGGRLLKFLDRKLNPEAERNNSNRIGNRTVDFTENNLGGER